MEKRKKTQKDQEKKGKEVFREISCFSLLPFCKVKVSVRIAGTPPLAC